MTTLFRSRPMVSDYLTARTSHLADRASAAGDKFLKSAGRVLHLPRRRSRYEKAAAPIALIAGVGAGAALMYIFDPQEGRRRRAYVRDQFAQAGHFISDRSQSAWIAARDRGTGLYARAQGLLRREPVSDQTLESRIRTKLGRITSHSESIDVAVNDGRVLLNGSALTSEVDKILRKIGRMRGVESVEHQLLQLDDEKGLSPTLQRLGVQAQGLRRRARETLGEWSPATRVAAGAAGSTLIASAFVKRGPIGAALGLAGLGLLAVGALAQSRESASSGESKRSPVSSDVNPRVLNELESSPS